MKPYRVSVKEFLDDQGIGGKNTRAGQPAAPRSMPLPLPAIDTHGGEIISKILDIGIGHGLRYMLHEAAVIRASSGLKVLQLLYDVVPMLPFDTRKSAAARIEAS